MIKLLKNVFMACIIGTSTGNFIGCNVIDGDLTLAEFQAQGIPSLCVGLVPLSQPVVFNTFWDDSGGVDGAFELEIFASTLADDDFVWILPSGALVEGKNLTIAANTGELDGVVRPVSLTCRDFSKIDGLHGSLFQNKKINGEVDLSLMTFSGMSNSNCNFQSNTLGGTFTAPKGGVKSINTSGGSNQIAILDLSNVTSFVVGAEIVAIGMFINTVPMGIASLDPLNNIQLNDNNMTSAQVNQILVDMDALAVSGTTQVFIGGNNSCPDSTSGGNDGIAAIVSLEGKGYSISTPAEAWNIVCAFYSGKEFDPSSEITGSTGGIDIGDAGSKMILSEDKDIYLYDLLTAYQVNSAVYAIDTFDASGEVVTGIRSLQFDPAGDIMIVSDRGSGIPLGIQYDLSTPFLPSTAVLGTTFSFVAQMSSLLSIKFSDDGTKCYVLGGGTIYQYSGMTTPFTFDGSFAYDSKNFTATEVTASSAFYLSDTEDKLFFHNTFDQIIYQYSLSTPGDIDTASYDGISFDPTNEVSGSTTELIFRDNGIDFYITDGSIGGSNKVFQYSTIP